MIYSKHNFNMFRSWWTMKDYMSLFFFYTSRSELYSYHYFFVCWIYRNWFFKNCSCYNVHINVYPLQGVISRILPLVIMGSFSCLGGLGKMYFFSCTFLHKKNSTKLTQSLGHDLLPTYISMPIFKQLPETIRIEVFHAYSVINPLRTSVQELSRQKSFKTCRRKPFFSEKNQALLSEIDHRHQVFTWHSTIKKEVRNLTSLDVTVLIVLFLAALFLPETLWTHLPNTLEEGESFGSNFRICSCPKPR